MLSTQVPSLQAICISQLSSKKINDLNELCMPEFPTLKERTNIRILGRQNPIKFVNDNELREKISELNDEYIHNVVSGYYNRSPRSKRLNRPLPELRIIIENNIRYSKAEFYDYYYYDHKLAKTKWEEAEQRLDPEGSNRVYTKHEFYNFYKNKKIAEVKWSTATRIKHEIRNTGINSFYEIYDPNDYDNLYEID